MILAYLSGLVAAFTPCVIVLIPLVLYSFHSKRKSSFLYFALGFMISYAFISFILGYLNANVQSGFKVGFGIVLIVLGLLSFFGKLNPLNLPLAKNSFIVGIVYSFLISLNPCTLPYAAIITAGNNVMINMMFFGLGIITPSMLFAFMGQKVLDMAKKAGKALHKIEKIMSVILVFAGLYMIVSITSLKVYDLYLVAFMLLVVFAILLRAFFVIGSLKDLKRSWLLLVSLLLIIATALFHCSNRVGEGAGHGLCMTNGLCPVCLQCVGIFAIAAILGFLGIFQSVKFSKNKNL